MTLRSNLKLGRRIGSGHFGEVFAGADDIHDEVAVKRLARLAGESDADWSIIRIAPSSMRRTAGGCSPGSTASMSTTARGASSAGIRNSISPMCCAACVRGRIFAAPWRARWDRRAITTGCLTMGRIPSPPSRLFCQFARCFRCVAGITAHHQTSTVVRCMGLFSRFWIDRPFAACK